MTTMTAAAKSLANRWAGEPCHLDGVPAKIVGRLRMRGLAHLQQPVPPKPEPRKVRIAYDAEGVYVGRLSDDDEIPPGCTVRLEKALY